MFRPLEKKERPERLELSRRLYREVLRLVLDRDKCLGCRICSTVCPRQAVRLLLGEDRATVTIDPRLCVLCEICAHFCPTGAIRIYLTEEPKTILRTRGLAPFYPAIQLDPARCPAPCPPQPEGEEHWCRQQRRLIANLASDCPKNCRRCLEACPRQVIKPTPDGTQVWPDPDLCLRCTQCLRICLMQAITIIPRFRGQLQLDDRRCPPQCTKCVEVCPVQLIVREGERVYLKQPTCSLCGSCLNVCDYGAIRLERTEVIAVPGEYCHAWDEAVARLTRD